MKFALFEGVAGLSPGYSESEVTWFATRSAAEAAFQQRLAELRLSPGCESTRGNASQVWVHFSGHSGPLFACEPWDVMLEVRAVQTSEAPGEQSFFIWDQIHSVPRFTAATISEVFNFAASLPEVHRWKQKPCAVQGEQWEMFVDDLTSLENPATLDIDDLVLHCFPIPANHWKKESKRLGKD